MNMERNINRAIVLYAGAVIEEGRFRPNVFEVLRKISDDTGYRLVPGDENFAKVLAPIFENERIIFEEFSGDYEPSSSFVIGSSREGKERAEELGFTFVEASDSLWPDILHSFCGEDYILPRKGFFERKTSETEISLKINLDGNGRGGIKTGIAFFDHMTDQLIKHSRIDMEGTVSGDLDVDFHHTVEDTAILIGQALSETLGEKKGIERYAYEILMMDDAVATVSIDLSGRPEFIWDVEFTLPIIGNFPTELIRHFFRSLSNSAKMNIYISANRGADSHHTSEAIFKAFARSLRRAIRRIPGETEPSSTKGVL